MREERLLKRLRVWKKEPVRRAKEDPKKVIDSVINHLQRILNTRQGSVQISQDYGIPCLTDLLSTYPESLREFERSIRQTIISYEPRLTMVQVKFLAQEEDVLSLKFQIIARIQTPEEKFPVKFESIIDSDGKIRIT